MLSVRPSLSGLKLLIPLLLIVGTTVCLYDTNIQIIVPDLTYQHNGPVDKKGAFVQEFLETEIDGHYDINPLKDLCATREWKQGLVVKCMPPPGGVGNVKNMLLNCLRFAFEAGATGLIIPEITGRGSDLKNINTDVRFPLSHFFDKEHFTSSLSTACPQIHLYADQSELAIYPTTKQEHFIAPKDLSPNFHPVATTVIESVASWHLAFHAWLNTTAPSYSASQPVLVAFSFQLLRFPLDFDDAYFVATFGRLFRFREDIRRLAATVLYSMNTKYHLDLDVNKQGVEAGKYYGAHLRTAGDAAAVGWPNYTTQAENYLSAAQAANLTLIYLTSGNPKDTERFSSSAANLSISVATKTLLLSEPGFEDEKKQMEELSWDQQGGIDYEVLLRSSFFGGMFESSFSWNAALRRHVVVGGGRWQSIGAGKQGVEIEMGGNGEDGTESFRDPLSVIFGPVNLGIRWQFPLALWP
jgi:hypothetical protein